MRILIVLPGLHRCDRGAENAFLALANQLIQLGESVTLIGSGPVRPGTIYKYIRAPSLRREYFEKYPAIPILRNEYCYEEFTFVPALLATYDPHAYDVTVTCSFPFTNWVLRRPCLRGPRPPHVFVTHNGDWPAVVSGSGAAGSEYRYFGCDGLVCINPEFYERNRRQWNCRLIPNGIDPSRFSPGPSERCKFGIPEDRFVVLMANALVPNKRVEMGIEAVRDLERAHLVLAGDGPLRDKLVAMGHERLPGRFTHLVLLPEQMPSLYRSADVLLQCSVDEPFGMVLLESMACGLPVVADDSPRVRYCVGDGEVLVSGGFAASFASGLRQAQQWALPLTSRNAKIRFSWNEVARSYQTFLREIVSSAGSLAATPAEREIP